MSMKSEKEETINLVLIAILTVIGFWVRFITFNKNELTHWDEGIYSFAGLWWATKGGAGIPPFVHIKYSPPLYPLLSSFLFIIFGNSAKAPIFTSILLGTLSIPTIYFLGKKLFNGKIGLLASAFLCVCEYHIIYSKMALTEATFLFFFLISIYFIYKAIWEINLYNFILVGISIAITSSIKYAGIFTLLIFSLSLLILTTLRKNNKKHAIILKYFLITLVIVAIFNLPWVMLIINKVGIRNFFNHFLSFSIKKTTNILRTNPKHILCFLSLWISAPILVLSVLGFLWSFYKPRFENIFLILWFTTYFFALTLYSPYPRLTLPLIPVIILFASSGFQSITSPLRNYKFISSAIITLLLIFSLYNSKDTILFYANSYKIAGDIINKKTPIDASIFLRTQANLPFYISRKVYSLEESNDLYSQVKNVGTSIFLVWDLTIDKNSVLYKSLIKEEKLKLIASVKNKLHPIVILNRYNCLFFKNNKNLFDFEDYIYIYELQN